MLCSVPARLQNELQQALWSKDDEADVVFELPDEEPLRQSSLNAAKTMRRAIRAVQTKLGVSEPIYYCVVNSPKIQATAFLLSGRFRCIAVWMGALLINQGTINRLVVMAPLARTLKLSPRPDVALGPFEGLDTFQAFQQLRQPAGIMASTAHERAVAAAITNTLANFIIMHEVAHAINGHLFVLNGPRMISESEMLDTSQVHNALVAHCLEWDADGFSAVSVLAATLRTAHAVEGFYSFKDRTDQLNFRLFLSLIAIYFACRLFETEAFSEDAIFQRRHPPGAVRLTLMLPQVREAWNGVTSAPFPEHLLAQVVRGCEQAIAELTGVDAPGFNLFANMPVGWFKGYQDKLWGEWARLQPKLVEHCVGSQMLPAPEPRATLSLSDIVGN